MTPAFCWVPRRRNTFRGSEIVLGRANELDLFALSSSAIVEYRWNVSLIPPLPSWILESKRKLDYKRRYFLRTKVITRTRWIVCIPLACSLSKLIKDFFQSSSFSCKGKTRQSIIALKKWFILVHEQLIRMLKKYCDKVLHFNFTYLVNDFIRVSTALCLRHIRVNAVPISLVAP